MMEAMATGKKKNHHKTTVLHSGQFRLRSTNLYSSTSPISFLAILMGSDEL